MKSFLLSFPLLLLMIGLFSACTPREASVPMPTLQTVDTIQYRNKTHGFSLSYPSSLRLQEQSDSEFGWSRGSADIWLIRADIAPTNVKNVDEWLNRENKKYTQPYLIRILKEEQFSGGEWTLVEVPVKVDTKIDGSGIYANSLKALLFRNGKMFMVTLREQLLDPDLKQIFEAMLRSIRFKY